MGGSEHVQHVQCCRITVIRKWERLGGIGNFLLLFLISVKCPWAHDWVNTQGRRKEPDVLLLTLSPGLSFLPLLCPSAFPCFFWRGVLTHTQSQIHPKARPRWGWAPSISLWGWSLCDLGLCVWNCTCQCCLHYQLPTEKKNDGLPPSVLGVFKMCPKVFENPAVAAFRKRKWKYASYLQVLFWLTLD